MFVPRPFAMNAPADQHAFIEEFGFGIIVSTDEKQLSHHTLHATHLPFMLKPHVGECGALYSHCARANPHWKTLDNTNVLVTFSGPHSYISPTWYKSGPAVPTWNYTAVHVYGKATYLSKKDTLLAVEEVTEKYEPELLRSRSIVTKAYQDKLLAGIVGIKVTIDRIEGQLKLGQQRNAFDQQGVYNGLSKSKQSDSIALANFMSKYKIGMGVKDD